MWCWGTNSNGQLGNFNVGIGSSSSQPVQVLIHDEMATPPNPPLSNLIRITAGHDHSCAMLGNRTLACWGNDYEGELGNNLRKTNFDSPQAVLVQGRSGLETLVFADAPISAGSFHGCGLVADVVVDSVACWGHNFYGELGLGDNTNRYTANAAQDEAGKITNAFFVTAGYDSTCAILADSTIRCWGTNAKDQLGNPGVALGNNALTGVEVLTSDGSAFNGVFELAAGAYHFCALHETDTEVYCWGDNSFSQLGVFSATQTNVPQRVAIDAPLFTDNFDGN